MIRNLLAIGATIAFFATFASAIAGSYFFLRSCLNRSSDGPRRWLVKMNRFNAILFPDELSPTGQQYRVRYLMALIATLCSGLILTALAVALAMTRSN